MMIRKHIPNLITLLNVFCGCVATVFAVKNQLEAAALFVALGIFFDFFDGLTARLLNVKSALGLQLDSLADVITSGLVPGVVLYQLFQMALAGQWDTGNAQGGMWNHWEHAVLPFFGFIVTMASAYRLAKFNVDEDQTDSFIGLPTPANAILVLSLPMMLHYQGSEVLYGLILNPWFLVGFTVISAFLLNARLPLFALKFKNWSFKDNALRYVFLGVSLVLLLTMRYMGVPIIILLYILGSLMEAKRSKTRD